MNIIVRTATKDDIEQVNKFLKEYFYSNENIFRGIFLSNELTNTEDELLKMYDDLYDITEASIIDAPCIIILNENNNEIIGVNAMLEIINPKFQSNNQKYDFYNTYEPRSKVVYEHFNYENAILDDADFFAKFPNANSLLEICIIGVHEGYRKKGLATLLINESIDYAKKNNIDIIGGLFTSPYSIRTAKNAGFKSIGNYDLSEFRKSKLRTPEPKFLTYNNVSVMAMSLNEF